MQAGSQVSLEYDINLSLTQIPENLIFYLDSARTNAIYKENGAIHLEGYFNQATANKTESRTLYWEWPMETGSTQNQINENDMLDSNWIGERIVLAVSAKGRQVTEENLTQQYAVTFDANGGTINGYGNSSQATKMVTYGEAYGALPTPTREGYTFMGWNGKNIVDYTKVNLRKATIIDQKIYLDASDITGNTAGSIQIQYYKNNSYVAIKKWIEDTGLVSYTFRKDDSFDAILVKVNTSILDPVFSFGVKKLQDGTTYTLTFNVDLFEKEKARAIISNIQLEENSTATAYEPYYITSSTEVVQNQNHTLTAIWEPKTN